MTQRHADLSAEDSRRLRDAYAIAALQGMLAHRKRYRPRILVRSWHVAIAKEAYELADAMMNARKET